MTNTDLTRNWNNLRTRDAEHIPTVSIVALSDNTGSQITVRDNGIGIDEADGNKVFEMFKRLHTQSDYEGTGIGLAICKKIVEDVHGGSIKISSTVGTGTAFQIALPPPDFDA